MSGLWILILGGIMFMFVGGPVKEMAFAVGGAILFSGTYILSYRLGGVLKNSLYAQELQDPYTLGDVRWAPGGLDMSGPILRSYKAGPQV